MAGGDVSKGYDEAAWIKEYHYIANIVNTAGSRPHGPSCVLCRPVASLVSSCARPESSQSLERRL